MVDCRPDRVDVASVGAKLESQHLGAIGVSQTLEQRGQNSNAWEEPWRSAVGAFGPTEAFIESPSHSMKLTQGEVGKPEGLVELQDAAQLSLEISRSVGHEQAEGSLRACHEVQ